MTISGERTEQLDIFCRVTGFTSDFLSFIDVELIRFFHRAIQFGKPKHRLCRIAAAGNRPVTLLTPSVNILAADIFQK